MTLFCEEPLWQLYESQITETLRNLVYYQHQFRTNKNYSLTKLSLSVYLEYCMDACIPYTAHDCMLHPLICPHACARTTPICSCSWFFSGHAQCWRCHAQCVIEGHAQCWSVTYITVNSVFKLSTACWGKNSLLCETYSAFCSKVQLTACFALGRMPKITAAILMRLKCECQCFVDRWTCQNYVQKNLAAPMYHRVTGWGRLQMPMDLLCVLLLFFFFLHKKCLGWKLPEMHKKSSTITSQMLSHQVVFAASKGAA